MPTTVTVDPSFSVCSLVNRLNVHNIFVERRKMLAQLCENIEYTILQRQLKADVYVGCQRLQYIAAIFPRLNEMAGVTRGTWIFGRPDAAYPSADKICFAPLQENDRLIREWFLVVHHPEYSRALVAQEITPTGTPHAERKFEGVLTGEPELVGILDQWLAEAVRRVLPTE